MDKIELKRHTRKLLSKKNRHDRLISQYVYFRHPDVYSEANECYDSLDVKYPGKRDLCKTLEFLQLTTGVNSYSQLYHSNRQKNKPKNKKAETTTTKKQHTDRMVLEIPLINSNTLTDETLSLNMPVYNELMDEIRNDPDLHAILNDFTIPGDETTDMSGPQHAGESFLGLPDKDYEGLVQELCDDPDLAMIFNDIEQTPLEKELSNLGYY